MGKDGAYHTADQIEALSEVMVSEVAVLREMLASMMEEQQAILEGDTEGLAAIIERRESIVAEMMNHRNKRCDIVEAMVDGDSPENGLELLAEREDSASSAVLLLRDKIAALMERLQEQAQRNNYLIENRVAMTKEMIRRLYPADKDGTYSQDGTRSGAKRTTVAIINREG